MRIRTWSLLVLFGLGGCAYPQFQFTGDPSPPADDAEPADVVEIDSFVPDTSPVDDGTALDDGTTTPDASTPDTATLDTTGIDAAMPDTSTAPDTKVVDLGVDTGPLSTGCVGVTSLFCRDFDTVTKVEDGWTYFDVAATGAVSLEKSGRSLPNAFLAEVKPGGPLVTADMGKTFTAPTLDSIGRVDLWIKLEAATYPGTSAFLFKYERAGDGVTFSIDDKGLYVDVIAPVYSFFAVPYVVVPNKWFHVRLEAKLRVAGGSVKLFIDDMTTPILDKTGISTLMTDSTSRLLVVGAYAEGLTAPFRVRYDDVRFDFF